MKVKIAPSLLSCDFARLSEEIKAVQEAGADMLHVDIMDGQFVPNITIGPVVVSAIKRHASIPLDVHLMIEKPERYLSDFVKAGSDILTVHVETCPHLHRTLQQLKTLKVKAGVSLNPSTPIDTIKHIWEDADMLLIMSVNPGFGGQEFIASMVPKIRSLRQLVGPSKDIEVDGGVTPQNAPLVIEAGANILVAGSSVFKTPDYKEAIGALRARGA